MSRKIKQIYHFLKSFLAQIIFGFPSRQLTLIGITGTDGKTTTTSMIFHILKKTGFSASKITTVNAEIGGKNLDTGLHTTTPDGFQMQQLLRQMVNSGSKYGVIEVSSHAIDQFRVLGCHFKIGVITNITSEHLDYHGTFENYRDTKLKLLQNSDTAIINSKDPSYKYIFKKLKSCNRDIISYPNNKLSSTHEQLLKSVFKEDYNYQNAKAAIAATVALGVSENQACKAIQTFSHVSGRMEKIKNKKGLNIIVDFAHTPNALANILGSLSKTKTGKLIAVFGCAGLRDKNKRQAMAKIAVNNADLSIFTAEDPRTESLSNILGQMEEGAKSQGAKLGKQYLKIPHRGKAIHDAINQIAQRGDTVVICGKGHERSLAFGNVEYPWSDQKAVAFALKKKIMPVKGLPISKIENL